MQTLDVNIIPKCKRIGEPRTITINAPERNASNIYKAWKLITKSNMPVPRANIPQSYQLSNNNNIPYIPMGMCSFL